MIAILTLAAGLLALPDGPSGSGRVTPAEFRDWFDAARAGTLVIPAEVGREARRFRYVFVAGFANERISGYFAQNMRELRSQGVPKGSIHQIAPSSHATLDANADDVRAQFLAIADEGAERLVIVAHSRGACDALAFALREPGFMADHVEALFLIQGPFGGTALADYVKGDGPAMDRRMPIRFRVVAHLIGRVERLVLRRGWHGGLADLTRAESRRYWARMLLDHAEAVAILDPKTYFIRSESPPARLGAFRRALGWYLDTYDGPNDGVVAVRDQYLRGMGTSLGVVTSGHGELTQRSRNGRSSRRLREALTRCIVMTVGRP